MNHACWIIFRRSCRVWAINDRWEAVPDATVRWRIVDARGAEQAAGTWRRTLDEDSAQLLGSADWISATAGRYELRAEVRARDDKQISENIFEFVVSP